MNRSSSKLKNISNKRFDQWEDESETDTSSILSNNRNEKSINNSDLSSDENSQSSSRRTCCLICSILPNLSHINTCQKHLTSLITPIPPTQVVYMMPPSSHCHCRSKSKRRYRSSSSSSSSSLLSSKPRHHRKKRSMTILSSNSSSQDDIFFSPVLTHQTITTNNQQQSNSTDARLSPSLPPSMNITSKMNTSLEQYQQLVLTSFLQRTNQQNNDEIETMLKNTQNNPIETIQVISDSRSSSPISNHRIIHVKDEDEVCNAIDPNILSINMNQMTEEMRNHEYSQPIILLKRVCIDENTPIYEQN